MEIVVEVIKKIKKHYLHRFIYEVFQGLIEDGYVIDHKDNDPSNNQLDNLQMITQGENSKKDYKDRSRKAKKIMAINVKTGETFFYKSQTGAAADLGLHQGNIYKVLSGLRKTILSKKFNERFTFKKVDSGTTTPIVIINNKFINFKVNTIKKVKIPLSHVRRLKLNSN